MSRRKPSRRPAASSGQGGGGVVTAPPERRSSFSWKIYGYALLVLVGLTILAVAIVWAKPLLVIDTVTRARLAYKGFHGEYDTLQGHRIHYLEGGSGPPVLLVHGLGSRAEDWANLMPLLAAGGYHVYAIDLLGYGRSDKPADAAYSISQEAGIVEAFLQSRQLERVNLAGWSMGGWIAMRVALDDPKRVSRLMLFDAAGLRFTPNYDMHEFEPKTPEQLQDLYSRLTPNAKKMPDFLSRAMLRRAQQSNWVIARSARSMFTGDDLLDGKLGALKMPVLIVWGKADALIPVATAVSMHTQIPQSTLELVDGCGHLAPGQCAPRIAPKVLDFLRGAGLQVGATLEIH